MIAEALPGGERHRGVDPRPQATGAVRASEDLELTPRAHIVNRRHPLLRDVTHRGVERGVFLLGFGVRYGTSDETRGVVLENTCRLTAGVAHDLAARHVLRLARH